MTDEIKVVLKVAQEGLKETTADTSKLKKEVEGATTATNSLNKAIKDSASNTRNKKSTGSYQEEHKEYGVTRGMVGTGAEGRDFAKQAQGLGGLVHVYATFAANIFAVTAAFTLLDKAYSNIRLEKAADIMSNKIGFSVKGLSKDLIEATDHAISFQEAMQFSNIGIAAGLTGKQITELTIMAKGAANALGRDMGDAVRRMIQGTAKQEQEILDELGIFVKAKTAYAEYAKKLGVGVDELTATQRVQAYADTVARAGQKWKDFAQIEDPFSKFVSTLKEAGSDLLNLVNKALVPLVSFLAQTKGLVEAIMVAVVGKLGMMALPHLGTQLKSMLAVDMVEVNKQIAGHQAIITSHRNTINELADKRNSVAGGMRNAYRSMNTAEIDFGKDTLIGSFAGKTTNVSELTKEAVADRVTKTIQKGIITETQLEAAKTQNLIYQRSTLDNIIVKKGAIKKLTEDALRISEEQNAALLQYRTIQGQILDKEAELVAIEEGRKGNTNPIGTANAKLRADSSSRIQGIIGASDIGWLNKGGDPGKAKQIWDELSGTIRGSIGWMGKASAAFMAFGEVASIALKGIMTAMPYLLAAFMAWDLIVKPLLYFFGFWSERQDKIDSATKRLTEDTDSLALSFANLYKTMNKDISGEQLTQNYTLRIRALTSVKDDIEKLMEEASRPSKTDSKYKDQNWGGFAPPKELTSSHAYSATGQRRVLEKSSQLLNLEKLTSTATDVDAQTDSWKKLYQIQQELLKLEDKRANDPTYLNYESEAKVKLLETRDAISLVIVEEERRATHLAGMLDPMRNASKTVQDFIDKGKESSDETIKQLGIVEPILQQAYKNREKALRNLMKEQNDVNKVGAINSFVTTVIDDYAAMGMATEGAAVRLKWLYQVASGPDAAAALEAQKLINEESRQYLLAVQERFDKEKKLASDRNAANLLFAQEQQLRALEIEGQKMLLKGKEQQLSVEEKLTGYKDTGILKQAKNVELHIAELEYIKNIAEITKKAEDDKNNSKAIEIMNKAKANALYLLELTKNITKEKYKQLDIESKLVEYQKTISSLIRMVIDTQASTNNVANINGLLSESDKIRLDTKAKILELDLQNEELQRKELARGTNIQSEAVQLADAIAHKNIEVKKGIIDQEAMAQLAKVARTNAISDVQKELTYLQLLRSETMDKSLQEFDWIVAIGLEKQIIAKQEAKTQAEITQIFYTRMSYEERRMALATLEIEKIKEMEVAHKNALESAQRGFSITNVATNMQTMYDMALLETDRFNKSLTPVITKIFTGIYAGMDSAIDSYLTKLQTGQKRTWHAFRDEMKNALSDQLKSAAADKLKSVSRDAFAGTMGIMGRTFGLPMLDTKQGKEDTVKTAILEQTQKEQFLFDQRTTDYRNELSVLETSLDWLRRIELNQRSAFGPATSGMVGTAAQFNVPTGSGVDAGMLAALGGNNMPGSFYQSPTTGQWAGSNNGAGVGSGLVSGVGSSLGSMIGNWLAGIINPHANGGIMTQYGPLKLNKYASGGIADRPQLALFGEGSGPEAYVPLTNGSIPVTLNSPNGTQGGGDTITVQVNVNTTTGTTNTAATGTNTATTNAYTQFANSVSQIVVQEIITQKRPGGLLA